MDVYVSAVFGFTEKLELNCRSSGSGCCYTCSSFYILFHFLLPLEKFKTTITSVQIKKVFFILLNVINGIPNVLTFSIVNYFFGNIDSSSQKYH